MGEGIPKKEDTILEEGNRKIPAEKMQSDFHYQAIAETEPIFQDLIKEVVEHVDKKEYFMVIGDDASGRIPALVMSRFLKKVYETDEKDPQTLETKFFAGARFLNKLRPTMEMLDKRAEEIGSAIKDDLVVIEKTKKTELKDAYAHRKRVLLVTDTVLSGGTLYPFVKALKDLYIPFDVMALGMIGMDTRENESVKEVLAKKKKQIENFFGHSIHIGIHNLPKVYDAKHLSGVLKHDKDLHVQSIFSDAHKFDLEYEQKTSTAEKIPTRETLADAREDVETLAGKLFKWYYHKE